MNSAYRSHPDLGAAVAAILLLIPLQACTPGGGDGGEPPLSVPSLHHVMLNSVDPDAAIEWYLEVWPAASRTEIAGYPAVEGDMYVLFNRVDSPPPGAFREDLHRAEPQSAFWHIGAFTNTSDIRERLDAAGIDHLPLFTAPDSEEGVWRSGLAPYAGILTEAQIAEAEPAEPREGGFSYVVGPDGALFELAGGPDTPDSFSHVHFYHEHPLCAANWYVSHLGMRLAPPSETSPDPDASPPLHDPCVRELAEASWPSLEPVGTIRDPRSTVHFANGSMSWYPRQCVGDRCGTDQPLVPSRGQVFDHVAFTIDDVDAWHARLRSESVTILEEPYPFGDTRAFMIEDLDGLAIKLVEEIDGAPED